jgi:hypothetical protein
VAKLANYVDSPRATVAWIAFIASWLYGRHYLMVWAFVSAARSYLLQMEVGAPTFNKVIQVLCMLCLVLLQGLNIFWLLAIIRGIRRVMNTGEAARDLRSDDEDED